MRTLNQRYAVASVLLGAVAPLVLYLSYSVPPPSDVGNIAKAIPSDLGKWTAVDEKVGGTPEERAILQTDAIFTRTYSCGTFPSFDLSIVYAQDNPNAIHPPELCYKGSGWTETVRDTIALAVGEQVFHLNRRHFVRGTGARMWVLYWFKAGSENTPRYLSFHWAALKARLLRSGCSCALLQVRAEFDPSAHGSEVLAELQKFAAVAIPAVSAAIP
ncbi:MAG TPA: EpsI family protein [Planctomycetota bacterium]|nr:EpsI family protein [Planctomycetota bacterium]